MNGMDVSAAFLLGPLLQNVQLQMRDPGARKPFILANIFHLATSLWAYGNMGSNLFVPKH